MFQVWTRPHCMYCEMAKKLLDAYHLEYELVDLNDETKPLLLERVPNAISVPQIFENGEHVGGYNDLAARLRARMGPGPT